MEHTYYVGDGPEATALIDEAFAKINDFLAECRKIIGEFPNTEGICHRGEYGPIYGIGIHMDHPLTVEQCADLGVLPQHERFRESFVYRPNGRSTKGKLLRERIEKANGKCISFSDYVLEKIKCVRWLSSPIERKMYLAVAGARDGKLFISIPGTPGDDDGEGRDPFPVVPSWLREPQGDEYKFFLR